MIYFQFERRAFILSLIVVASLALAACGSNEAPAGGEERIITLMTHESFDVSESVLAAFEAETGISVALLPAGDAGAALSQAILTRDDPLADVFFGVDNTFMGRALAADLFVPYASPALADVPAEYRLDEGNRLLPVDVGDVCLNYDIAWFTAAGLAPPQSLSDLVDPAYAGLLAVENPATSSPGLAFLLATIDLYGTEGEYTYLDYWAALRDNDVLVASGWADAYYGAFSAASDGDRPLVVSYASSPPAEVYFNELTEAPTAAIVTPGSCFRQIEFVGILKGTADLEGAQLLVDFMLSESFQNDIPLRMFVFPVNSEARVPAVFSAWTELPAAPAFIDPVTIDENRGAWIDAWTAVMFP